MGLFGPTVLFAGHISLDIIPDIAKRSAGYEVFRPGAMVLAEGTRFSTGGAVLNTGLALHRLGLGARLLVKIGRDPYGQVLRTLIDQALRVSSEPGQNAPHSELILLEDPEAETSSTWVLSPSTSDRMFVCCPGTNRTFTTLDVTESQLQGIELFHFGYPPLLENIYADAGASLATLFAKLQGRGIVTSLDMCMPELNGDSGQVDWRAFLARVLPHLDIFMPSIEEILFMLDRPRFLAGHAGNIPASLTGEELTSLSQSLLDMGARVVGIKLGDEGLYVRTSKLASQTVSEKLRPGWWQSLLAGNWHQRELYIPCFRAEVVGTTGAGDSTIAGFLAGMVSGLALEDCMTHAVAVGACSVEQVDATSGIPPWSEVQARMHQGWAQVDAQTNLKYWPRCDNCFRGPNDTGSSL